MIYDATLSDELDWEYNNINLLDIYTYHNTYNLNGINLVLFYDYNERSKLRSLRIEDTYGNVLLPNTFIKYGRRVELNQLAQLSGLDYYVTLRPLDSSKSFDNYDYFNWSKDFNLCFCGRDYSLTTRVNDNYIAYLTQNY